MAKVNIIEPGKYEYECTCGTKIVLETDTRPDKLIKCFKCLKKLDEVFDEKNRNENRKK